MNFRILVASVACLAFAFLSGCDNGTTAKNSDTPAHELTHGDGHDHDDHAGHDHGESDLPVHGPNHGHLFRLKDTKMVGEWCHYKDNNVIRMFLLEDKDGNVVAADAVTVTPTAGSDKNPFNLEGDSNEKAGGSFNAYMLDDQKLHLAMNLGVKVEFKVGDKTYSGEIEPHEPHEH